MEVKAFSVQCCNALKCPLLWKSQGTNKRHIVHRVGLHMRPNKVVRASHLSEVVKYRKLSLEFVFDLGKLGSTKQLLGSRKFLFYNVI